MSDSNQKEIKLKAEVSAMSAIIAKGLTISKDGIASLAEDTVEQCLPEGMTLKDVKKVNDFRDTLVAASAHALAEPAVKAMAKDKKLESVSMVFKVASDSIGHTIERVRLTGAPGGEKTPKAGYTVTKYEVNGAGKNRGELKKVHTIISNLAAEAALG